MARVTPDENWTALERTQVPRQTSRPIADLTPEEQLAHKMLDDRAKVGEDRLAEIRKRTMESLGNHPLAPPHLKGQDATLPDMVISDEEHPVNTDGPVPDGFQRTSLPSGYLGYPFKSLAIKPLSVTQMIDVNSACASDDAPWLHDILDQTITQDIRSLWVMDYLYILAFHRLNSYTEFPFEFKAESLYGNTIEHRITTSVVLKNLDLTEEQYEECLSHGIRLPTVKDDEIARNHVLDDKVQAGRWEKAQFLQGNTVEEKLSALDSLTPKGLSLIRMLTNAVSKAGVFEWAQVSDPHVASASKKDRAKYTRHIKGVIKRYEENADKLHLMFDEAGIERIKARIEESRMALERLNEGEAEPLLETIYLEIEEMNFLPKV